MRTNPSGKTPSHRQQRVAEEIRHILSRILLKGDFSRRDISVGSVTITHVVTSPDLKHAKVYVMPLGGGEATVILAHLNQMAGEIRYAMAKNLSTKYIPALRFYVDDTFDQASHIDRLIDSAIKRDKVSSNTGSESD